MALKLDKTNSSNSISAKVSGDLGDIQVTYESDNENNKQIEKKVSRTLTTKPAIPPNLIQNTVPVFGSVSVSSSENVQFGNNTYFNGPVTIKQIIQNKSGVDNAAYVATEGEIHNAQKSHKGETADNSSKKEQILLWHKITFCTVCITVVGSIIAIVLVLQNKTEQQRSNDRPTDFQSPVTPINTTVVGYCLENFQVTLFLLILLPLISTILYSLLTKNAIGNEMVCVAKANDINFNCVDAFCKQCNEEGDPLLIAPDHLRIVSRTEWIAEQVDKPLTALKLPAPWVIITHTATESCNTQIKDEDTYAAIMSFTSGSASGIDGITPQHLKDLVSVSAGDAGRALLNDITKLYNFMLSGKSQCVLRVRLIQTFHIESRGWYDIGYNFLVGGDGSVYYGRGWDYEGAHTKGYNKYSIGIAFVGTFNSKPPPKRQVEACQKLIKQGVQLNKIDKDYKLFAHRQLMSTLSPGDEVYNIIKTWPHFVSNFSDLESLIPRGS